MQKEGLKDVNALISKYDSLFRICALRFCNESNFEDFVQEGVISLLEKSINQFSEEENFDITVIRNCLRYQQVLYLRLYSDEYPLFDEQSLIKKYKLCCSLFGSDTNSISSKFPLTFEETRDLCSSFVEHTNGQLKRILTQLYRLE